MEIEIRCPKCHKKYRLEASAAGKRARCANCNQSMQIPQLPEQEVIFETAEPAVPQQRSRPLPPPLPKAPQVASEQLWAPVPEDEPVVGSMPPQLPVRSAGRGMHRQRIVFVVCSVATLVSMLFTWVTVGPVSFSGFWIPTAYLSLFLSIPAFIIGLIGEQSRPVLEGKRLGASIPTGIAAMLCLMNVWTSWNTVAESSWFGNEEISLTRPGMGAFIALGATLTMTVGAWLLVGRDEANGQ